jgi:hypothetical protein
MAGAKKKSRGGKHAADQAKQRELETIRLLNEALGQRVRRPGAASPEPPLRTACQSAAGGRR